MSRINKTIDRLTQSNEKALIPYFMANYPDKDTFLDLIRESIKAGADLIEVGLPFSDPIADGPAIQRAGFQVQQAGFTRSNYFELILKIREEFSEIPLICMTYFNLILKHGLQNFIKESVKAGLDGLIVPDLPVDEADELKKYCQEFGLDLILLVAPTSSIDRIQKISENSSGFIYCVTLTGVTGARTELPEGVKDLILRVKKECKLPVFAGFGVSNAAQAASIKDVADGVIIGSAIINIIDQSKADEIIENVVTFIRNIKETLK